MKSKNQKSQKKKKASEQDRPDFYLEAEQPNPASQHDFPNFGIVETDFVTHNYGRTTGRMLDHEPGI